MIISTELDFDRDETARICFTTELPSTQPPPLCSGSEIRYSSSQIAENAEYCADDVENLLKDKSGAKFHYLEFAQILPYCLTTAAPGDTDLVSSLQVGRSARSSQIAIFFEFESQLLGFAF